MTQPPEVPATDQHQWEPFTAPNGDRGFVCRQCRLTAIHLPVAPPVWACPARPTPTLAELLAEVRAARSRA